MVQPSPTGAKPAAEAVRAAAPARRLGAWDDAELHQRWDSLDHVAHANLARLTGGHSPAAIVSAFMGWAVHLAISPGKQVELAAKGARQWMRLAQFASRCAACGGTPSFVEAAP